MALATTTGGITDELFAGSASIEATGEVLDLETQSVNSVWTPIVLTRNGNLGQFVAHGYENEEGQGDQKQRHHKQHPLIHPAGSQALTPLYVYTGTVITFWI